MRRVLIIICLLYTFTANGQDTCFGNCLENLGQSTLPFLERNKQILQGLVGCKAPDFTVKTIDGETLSLEQLQGKVIVINFWFESCAPCIAELPALNRLREEYKSKDVVFIAFGKDDSQTIKDFLKRRDFKYLQFLRTMTSLKNIASLPAGPPIWCWTKKASSGRYSVGVI